MSKTKKIARKKQDELKDYEKSIMAQALADMKSIGDIPIIINKVEGTAVGFNKNAWKQFLELLKLKTANSL